MLRKRFLVILSILLILVGTVTFITESTAYIQKADLLSEIPSSLFFLGTTGIPLALSSVVLVRWDSDIDEAAYSDLVAAQSQIALENARQMPQAQENEFRQLRESILGFIDEAESSIERNNIADITGAFNESLQIIDKALSGHVGNQIINTITRLKSNQMESKGITLNASIALNADIPLSNTELAAVLFNLLDNAMSGAVEIGGDCVNLRIHTKAEQFLIEVSNPCSSKLQGRISPAVHPKKSHGWGMGNVKIIAEAHGGIADFHANKGLFTADVMIPL